MRSDPPVRGDRKCVVCGKPLNIKPRATLNPVLYIDPFCSAECARAYHGVVISKGPHPKPPPERTTYDTCPDCGGRKKHSSARCRSCAQALAAREPERRTQYERSCNVCGVTFTTSISRQRFCSRTCANKHWHQKRKARG